MSGQNSNVERLREEYRNEIDRLTQEVQNAYSISKVSFIYGRLKKLGPWKPEDLNMEVIFEIDTLQGALAFEYARVFDGPRKVSEGKVPKHLKSTHDEIMKLRNKRYAHQEPHPSVSNSGSIRIDGERVILESCIEMETRFGAPEEWGELIDWLEKYVFDQTEKQLKSLSKSTGLEWVRPEVPLPG